MSKRRRLQIPGMPKSAGEFDELLLHRGYTEIHKVTGKVDTKVSECFHVAQNDIVNEILQANQCRWHFLWYPNILSVVYDILHLSRAHYPCDSYFYDQQFRRAL